MHKDYRDKINEAGKSVCVCVSALEIESYSRLFPKSPPNKTGV